MKLLVSNIKKIISNEISANEILYLICEIIQINFNLYLDKNEKKNMELIFKKIMTVNLKKQLQIILKINEILKNLTQ